MKRLVISAIALLAAPLARAQEDPKHIGTWLVGTLDANSCQAEGRYADHYLLNVSEDSIGNGHFIFADDRWLLKEGDVKPATYSWDGWKTSKQGKFAAVAAPDGKFMLVMETHSDFSEDMAGSRNLALRVPGVDFDDDFAIPNGGDIAKEISICNSKH